MLTIKSQEEAEKLIKDGEIIINEDVTFEVSVKLEASLIIYGDIDAYDIDAYDIDAYDIVAHNVDAHNVDAYDIVAYDIDAYDIVAYDIVAHNVDAHNVDAYDIVAHNIVAHDIKFWSFAIARISFKCKSWTASRQNGFAKCLDDKIKIIK